MLEFSRRRFRWLILCGLVGFGAIWLHERRPPARRPAGVAIGRAATPAAPSSVLSVAVSDASPAFARGALFATIAPPPSVLAAQRRATSHLPSRSRAPTTTSVTTIMLSQLPAAPVGQRGLRLRSATSRRRQQSRWRRPGNRGFRRAGRVRRAAAAAAAGGSPTRMARTRPTCRRSSSVFVARLKTFAASAMCCDRTFPRWSRSSTSG